jgi:DNA-binding MarR family transcriptional regulator
MAFVFLMSPDVGLPEAGSRARKYTSKVDLITVWFGNGGKRTENRVYTNSCSADNISLDMSYQKLYDLKSFAIKPFEINMNLCRRPLKRTGRTMDFSKPKPEDQSDEAILCALRRISNALMQHSREFAGRYNLSLAQVLCLKLLIKSGALTSSELARRMYLSHGTITWMGDRLEAAGRGARSRDDVDRRKVTVSVTEQGRRTAENVPLSLQGRFSAELAALPPGRREAIARVLEQVLKMMEMPET